MHSFGYPGLPTTIDICFSFFYTLIEQVYIHPGKHRRSHYTNEELNVDAIIGRYRLRMEDTGLILRHVSGINFDMAPDEALGLLNFLSAYRENLISFREPETDHNLKQIPLEEAEHKDEQS
jgi:hypothetical protein